MSNHTGGKPQSRSFGWPFWWVVNPSDLSRQVEGYDTLKWYQSARGQSLALLLMTSAISVAMIELASHARAGYLDIAAFVGLGVFIYRGHQWAMLGAMGVWTLEKLFQLAGAVQANHSGYLIGMLLWWAIYMRAFNLAWRTERARRRPIAADPSIFD